MVRDAARETTRARAERGSIESAGTRQSAAAAGDSSLFGAREASEECRGAAPTKQNDAQRSVSRTGGETMRTKRYLCSATHRGSGVRTERSAEPSGGGETGLRARGVCRAALAALPLWTTMQMTTRSEASFPRPLS